MGKRDVTDFAADLGNKLNAATFGSNVGLDQGKFL